MEQKKERVIAYVDGFNLYFGLKESGYERYLWLNLQALAASLLKPHQQLVGVKYFTTKISDNYDKRKRQAMYLNALLSLTDFNIYYGTWKRESHTCNVCTNIRNTQLEKMTDVSIAVHMIHDAHCDKYDAAMLISGDTDHIPQIRMINEEITSKRVFVAFPPNRINDDVRKHANGDFVIGRKKLQDSQFPDNFENKAGEKILRPGTWI